MSGGGEGDLDGVREGVLNLYWLVCGDDEGKGNDSAGDLRLDRKGCGGGEGDLDEASEGVPGRHQPVHVRDGGVGEMVLSTRYRVFHNE